MGLISQNSILYWPYYPLSKTIIGNRISGPDRDSLHNCHLPIHQDYIPVNSHIALHCPDTVCLHTDMFSLNCTSIEDFSPIPFLVNYVTNIAHLDMHTVLPHL